MFLVGLGHLDAGQVGDLRHGGLIERHGVSLSVRECRMPGRCPGRRQIW
jgi:hypothetical protein